MAKVNKINKKSRSGGITKVKVGEKQKVKGNKVITKVNKKPENNVGEILKINKKPKNNVGEILKINKKPKNNVGEILKIIKKPKNNVGEILKINKTEVDQLKKVTVNKIKKPKETKTKKVKVKKVNNIEEKPGLNVDTNAVQLPPKRMSNDPTPKQVKWINRQRVLVFAARGINHRHRHLMEDLKKLMPHHKAESKMERSKTLYVVNEICEMKNCNKCILFEGRKMRDLYMWMSNIPNGPSVKFVVENIYTMGELKMTGNCLRGSRPLLSFDSEFSKEPHYELLKELLVQIFGVPNNHPKSQPFFDHVYSFMIMDNRIWFRNYQILSEDGALAEIGPRFVLNPVKIFSGSFGGLPLWENPKYVSPAKLRQAYAKRASNKYQNRVEQRAVYEATKPETSYPDIEGTDFFKGDPMVKAEQEVGAS